MQTGAFTAAASPVTTEGPQTSTLVPSPDGHFLYEDWSEAGGAGHLRVYATDVSGVPQLPAVQALDLPIAGTFRVHPGGQLAYYLHTAIIGDGDTGTVVADLYAFQIDPLTGKLTEVPNPVGTSSGPAMFWLDRLYGFSSDGTQLYEYNGDDFDGEYNNQFTKRAVNLQTGALGEAIPFFTDSSFAGDTDAARIAGQFVFYLFAAGGIPEAGRTDVFDASQVNPTVPFIHCTNAMLAICQTASDLRAEPAGEYLFFMDQPTNRIHLVKVSATDARLVDTNSSMPLPNGNLADFRFSPDGNVAYTVVWAGVTTGNDAIVTPYVLSRATGTLTTSGASITAPSPDILCPAVRK